MFVSIVNTTTGNLVDMNTNLTGQMQYTGIFSDDESAIQAVSLYQQNGTKLLAMTGYLVATADMFATENAYQQYYGGGVTDTFLFILDVTNPKNVSTTYFSFFGKGDVENGNAIVTSFMT